MRGSSVFLTVAIVAAALLFSACGVPNLESQPCSDARYALRTFYSFHFDVGMTGERARDVEIRREYLTPRFFEALSKRENAPKDPFTVADSLPTTFKIGECSENGDRAHFRVQVYWRDDSSTVQKDIFVRIDQQDGKWLIDEITEHPN
jgi:hypothetical protein